MEAVSKFRSNVQSSEDVLLFIRIFLLITILPVLIRFLALPRLMKVLTRDVSGLSGRYDHNTYREQVIRFTDFILSRNFWMYRSTCLKRSLVLYRFLHTVAPDMHICFGVKLRKDSPQHGRDTVLEGHAWLIQNGENFADMNQEITSTYTVTYCFPERSSGA